MTKITPFLWFDSNAEEAMHYYVSIFPNSKVGQVQRAGPDGPVFGVAFTLDGQDFMGLNGGPMHKFTEAISMFVSCETQQQVDELWAKLTTGGEESRCGWLKDKYGLSWQIVPSVLGRLLGDKDPATAKRVMDAMMTMGKIEITALQQAAEG